MLFLVLMILVGLFHFILKRREKEKAVSGVKIYIGEADQ